MKVRELIAQLSDDIDPESEVLVEYGDGFGALGPPAKVVGLESGMSFGGGYTATLICR